MDTVIVRYAEVALKGKNRGRFVNQLADNIQQTLGLPPEALVKEPGQLVIAPDETTPIDKLANVFGVAWYAPARTCPNTLESIRDSATDLALPHIPSDGTFAVRARRADKDLSFTSKALEIATGTAIQEATGAAVDLDAPDHTIHIYAGHHRCYIFTEKRQGPGGLPVGVSGRALCLLSGGFDSIAAGYLAAKRGAQVDFLHFHVFPDLDGVRASKIPRIAAGLRTHTLSSTLHLASDIPYQMATLSLGEEHARYELVVFRRLMARVAEHVARREGYQALVFGDSLGQVASQTMENLAAVTDAVEIPIFRPVIGFDKQEVIDLVDSIGLYDLAVESYKDCCSIIATNPATRANLDRVAAVEAEIDAVALAREIADTLETLPLHPAHQPAAAL